MPSSEREDLQELLSIPGFQRFVRRTLHEYAGEGYRARIRAALKNKDLLALQVVEEAAKAVEELLNWPEQRLMELQEHPEEDDDTWN